MVVGVGNTLTNRGRGRNKSGKEGETQMSKTKLQFNYVPPQLLHRAFTPLEGQDSVVLIIIRPEGEDKNKDPIKVERDGPFWGLWEIKKRR